MREDCEWKSKSRKRPQRLAQKPRCSSVSKSNLLLALELDSPVTRSLEAKRSEINGAGISLHLEHLDEVLETFPTLGWFELLVENFLSVRSEELDKLCELRASYPFTFHGVGLSLGSTVPA